MDKIDTAVDFIHERINNKEVLACYLVKYHKHSAKDAIDKLREKRPGSIQSETQEIAIRLYEKHVKN